MVKRRLLAIQFYELDLQEVTHDQRRPGSRWVHFSSDQTGADVCAFREWPHSPALRLCRSARDLNHDEYAASDRPLPVVHRPPGQQQPIGLLGGPQPGPFSAQTPLVHFTCPSFRCSFRDTACRWATLSHPIYERQYEPQVWRRRRLPSSDTNAAKGCNHDISQRPRLASSS